MIKQFQIAFTSAILWLLIIGFPTGGYAAFEACNQSYNIKAGFTYLQSPNYPNKYTSGTSCRYKFTAPLNYDIRINCTINLPKGSNGCTSDFFYVSTDGDTQLRSSERFCGQGRIVRKSDYRSIVLAYISNGANGANGRFRCTLFAAPQPCDCGWSLDTKILNGVPASTNEYPSMVALRDRTSNLEAFCGGTILNHNFIVTAAHCTRRQPVASNIVARVGDNTLKGPASRYAATYRIQRIIEHPNYVADPVRNDIALLQTAQPIEWSRGVGPICLPPIRQNSNDFAYSPVDVIGWGTTSFGGPPSNALRKVSLQVALNSACKRSYNGTAPIYLSQICTYDNTGNSRDTCQYDSGGPVIYRANSRQFILGIVSFGKICGQDAYAMGVNTRITTYSKWLRSHMNVCNKSF